MAYHQAHKLDTKIIRIFNTYGPRMRLNDGRAIPAFISQALRSKPLPVFGDGSQTRSFCYVDDLIVGIKKVVYSSINDPINLGNPNELSILDLAKAVIEFTGSESKIEFKSLPVDDPKVRQPDITKAKRQLGWEPKIDLKDGLIKTIEYFKKHVTELKDSSMIKGLS